MSLFEKCPNEIFHAIACNMTLGDVLNCRLVCPRAEAGLRSYIVRTYFSALRVPFSEDGLHPLVRKTRCQRFIRGLRSMTVRFYQKSLYYPDYMDPFRLKDLHHEFFASRWHDSEPQTANTTQKLNQ